MEDLEPSVSLVAEVKAEFYRDIRLGRIYSLSRILFETLVSIHCDRRSSMKSSKKGKTDPEDLSKLGSNAALTPFALIPLHCSLRLRYRSGTIAEDVPPNSTSPRMGD
jgi:hypothetical protein